MTGEISPMSDSICERMMPMEKARDMVERGNAGDAPIITIETT